MPEQISKYPDVTLQVLKGAGAKCGEGAAQKILTQCPAARFCALPTGEICVYGIDEIPHMTQIDVREIAAVVAPSSQLHGIESPAAPWLEALIVLVTFLAGLALGMLWKKRRNSDP
jgi:hypothetical protein